MEIKLGKYKHFKGHEYEVIGLADIAKHRRIWLFTKTRRAGCG